MREHYYILKNEKATMCEEIKQLKKQNDLKPRDSSISDSQIAEKVQQLDELQDQALQNAKYTSKLEFEVKELKEQVEIW